MRTWGEDGGVSCASVGAIPACEENPGAPVPRSASVETEKARQDAWDGERPRGRREGRPGTGVGPRGFVELLNGKRDTGRVRARLWLPHSARTGMDPTGNPRLSCRSDGQRWELQNLPAACFGNALAPLPDKHPVRPSHTIACNWVARSDFRRSNLNKARTEAKPQRSHLLESPRQGGISRNRGAPAISSCEMG